MTEGIEEVVATGGNGVKRLVGLPSPALAGGTLTREDIMGTRKERRRKRQLRESAQVLI